MEPLSYAELIILLNKAAATERRLQIALFESQKKISQEKNKPIIFQSKL